MMEKRILSAFLLLFFLQKVGAYQLYSYGPQSCSDLKPKLVSPPECQAPSCNVTNAPLSRDGILLTINTGTVYMPLTTLKVNLYANNYFEGFMLQARNRSNNAVIGHFEEVPRGSQLLKCTSDLRDTVVDRRRPTLHKNLTFIWRAPEQSAQIYFTASVTWDYGSKYNSISGPVLTPVNFPVSREQCIGKVSCFRICPAERRSCAMNEAVYAASIDFSNRDWATVNLGGLLPQDKGAYIGIGLTKESDLLDTDMIICSKTDTLVMVEHYFLDSRDVQPDPHQTPLSLMYSQLSDRFMWCTFSLPMRFQQNSFYKWDIMEMPKIAFIWGIKNGTYMSVPSYSDTHILTISRDDMFFNEPIVADSQCEDLIDCYGKAALARVDSPLVIAAALLSLLLVSTFFKFIG